MMQRDVLRMSKETWVDREVGKETKPCVKDNRLTQTEAHEEATGRREQEEENRKKRTWRREHASMTQVLTSTFDGRTTRKRLASRLLQLKKGINSYFALLVSLQLLKQWGLQKKNQVVNTWAVFKTTTSTTIFIWFQMESKGEKKMFLCSDQFCSFGDKEITFWIQGIYFFFLYSSAGYPAS